MSSRPYKRQRQRQAYQIAVVSPVILGDVPPLPLAEMLKQGFRADYGPQQLADVGVGNWLDQLAYAVGQYGKDLFARTLGQGFDNAEKASWLQSIEHLAEGGPGVAIYENGIRVKDYSIDALETRCENKCKKEHPGTYPVLGLFNNCYCRKTRISSRALTHAQAETRCVGLCKSRFPGRRPWVDSMGSCFCKAPGTSAVGSARPVGGTCSQRCANIGWPYGGKIINQKCICNRSSGGQTTSSGKPCAPCARGYYRPASYTTCQCKACVPCRSGYHRGVSGCSCVANSTNCGTQNGCAEDCYRLGNSRYGAGKYRMNPKQTSCTNCSCNFTKCGTQNGCAESCYRLGNSRYGAGKYRMSPKQTSCTNCSCNFVKCGTQSGCTSACKKKGYVGGTQKSCTSCICGAKAFHCPYSGCGGTGSWSQCYLCRCRGICNNATHGGVKSVSSNGSCYCNH